MTVSWISVKDNLPPAVDIYNGDGAAVLADTALVWVARLDGTGWVMTASFRTTRLIHPDDYAEAPFYVADPHFYAGCGDQDYEWPQSMDFCSIDDGYSCRVTHWMPLPAPPEPR